MIHLGALHLFCRVIAHFGSRYSNWKYFNEGAGRVGDIDFVA